VPRLRAHFSRLASAPARQQRSIQPCREKVSSD
jgi:hypothetical protein